MLKNAQNVLVWLGVPTEPARQLLEQVFKHTLSLQEEKILDTVFSGGWWERLWVIQEAAHAKSLVVRCGSFERAWEEIEKIGSRFISLSIMRSFLRRSCDDVVDVLELFGSQKCYNPRDVIFALRSIFPVLMPIVPDYSACTADVSPLQREQLYLKRKVSRY